MLVYDSNKVYYMRAPEFPDKSVKAPREAAKDVMGQVHQSPCKVSMLKATLVW